MNRNCLKKERLNGEGFQLKISLFNFLVLAMVTIGFVSCSGTDSSDSKQKADSTNTARVDSAKSRDTTSGNNTSMADLKPDAQFAVNAADGGMMEVTLGKMAAEKAVTKEVKMFGKTMVTDHSKGNSELKTLAMAKNIAIPDELSDKCRKEADDLGQKKGIDFDKAYIDMMVKDHKEDIDEFKKESEKGNDSQISEWAKAKIPTLEHHLTMAQDAQKTLEK